MELIRSCFEGVIKYSNSFRSSSQSTTSNNSSSSSKYNESITAITPDGSSEDVVDINTNNNNNNNNKSNNDVNHNVNSLNNNQNSDNINNSDEKQNGGSVNDNSGGNNDDISENSRSINENNNSNNSNNNNNNNNGNSNNSSNNDNNDQQDDNINNNSNNNNNNSSINSGNEENDIFSINFSSWSKSKQLLMENGKAIFEASGLVKDLNLSDSTVHQFLEVVSSSYRENPFHSFNHAIAVTQTIFLVFIKANLLNILTPLEKLSIIVASICHDLDHPALSNRFQINIKSPIAILYNNKSVLENHHLSICLKILSSNVGLQLIESLSGNDKEVFLNKVKILILATDMENHFNYKSQFDECIKSFDWKHPQHRDLLLIMLLKSADISNELRSFDISNKWANALMQEFFNQSDLEKLNNLPVTPFMEREKVVLHLTQVSFIEKFLLPSYQSLQVLLPSLEDFVLRIKENKDIWSNNGN